MKTNIKKYTTTTATVNVDVDICVQDILDELDTDELIEYLNNTESNIQIGYISNELYDYTDIVDGYFRYKFDIFKLFDKLGKAETLKIFNKLKNLYENK